MWKEQLSPPDALGLPPRWHLRSALGQGAEQAPAEAVVLLLEYLCRLCWGQFGDREGALPVQLREGVFLGASRLREQSHGSLPLP